MHARTDSGTVRAIGFPISRANKAYLPGLTTDQIGDALATAAGERGSIAEYLYNTITQLRVRCIQAHYLWRLLDLVARRIEAGLAEGAN